MEEPSVSPYLQNDIEEMERVIQGYLRETEEKAEQMPRELEPVGASRRFLGILGGAFALGLILGMVLEARRRSE